MNEINPSSQPNLTSIDLGSVSSQTLVTELKRRLETSETRSLYLNSSTAQSQSTRRNVQTLQTLIVLIPLFNDWEVLEQLLFLLDEVDLPESTRLEIVVVDDYSSDPMLPSLGQQDYRQIAKVSILRLRRNLGHQRAIAIGLSYLHQHFNPDWVVVMDGDGEDNPFEITRLLEVSHEVDHSKIIFARRSKRSEGSIFKVFYYLYRSLYHFLVGREIRVGNFSLLPAHLLKNIVVISEIWNHYSAGLRRSRFPYLEVNIPRTRRLAGQPKMNLVSLVTHGLSSIAVYGDIVGTRILLSISILLVLFCMALIGVLAIKFFTNLAIPGWTTYAVGLLVISCFQLILLGTIFSMLILSTRNQFNFIPARDYQYYVDSFREIKS